MFSPLYCQETAQQKGPRDEAVREHKRLDKYVFDPIKNIWKQAVKIRTQTQPNYIAPIDIENFLKYFPKPQPFRSIKI